VCEPVGIESWAPDDAMERLTRALGARARAPGPFSPYSADVPPELAGDVSGGQAAAWGVTVDGPVDSDGSDGPWHD
jgi:hypothetical protein